MSADPPKPLLTPRQLCEWLRISEATLDSYIKNDPTFPLERLGNGPRRPRRFDEDRIRAWMAQDSTTSAA